MADSFKVAKFFEIVVVGIILVGLAGCESSSSITSQTPKAEQSENYYESVDIAETSEEAIKSFLSSKKNSKT